MYICGIHNYNKSVFRKGWFPSMWRTWLRSELNTLSLFFWPRILSYVGHGNLKVGLQFFPLWIPIDMLYSWKSSKKRSSKNLEKYTQMSYVCVCLCVCVWLNWWNFHTFHYKSQHYFFIYRSTLEINHHIIVHSILLITNQRTLVTSFIRLHFPGRVISILVWSDIIEEKQIYIILLIKRCRIRLRRLRGMFITVSQLLVGNAIPSKKLNSTFILISRLCNLSRTRFQYKWKDRMKRLAKNLRLSYLKTHHKSL